jgi:outer membrane murein-binding lipoprotein Lpp
MVERARPNRLRRWLALGACALACACAPGCANESPFVPRADLNECRKFNESLQAETAQLKDTTLKLRAHNQDLAQRSADDSKRIDQLTEENDRLTQTVQAYQDERDQLAQAFDQFKRQITAAGEEKGVTNR